MRRSIKIDLKVNNPEESRKILKEFFSKKRNVGIIIGFVIFFFGFLATYILLLIFSPQIDYYAKDSLDSEVARLESSDEIDSPNELIIPKIKVKEEIIEGGEDALNKGVWHRKPSQADPLTPGNFILTAHRFNIRWTPGQVVATSPFYHIERLEKGDLIYVVWEKKLYKYKVSDKFKVEPNQVSIEDQTEESQLTMYTCTLGGRNDGRDVIIAKPL